jgi:hypothetical protein
MEQQDAPGSVVIERRNRYPVVRSKPDFVFWPGYRRRSATDDHEERRADPRLEGHPEKEKALVVCPLDVVDPEGDGLACA